MLLKPIINNRNCPPDTANFIDAFDAQFFSGGHTITGIAQLYYQGPIAASEFLTYAATKLYVALNVKFDGAVYASGTQSKVTLYDELNAIVMYLTNDMVHYAAAVNYSPLTMNANNLYFSRIVAAGGYSHMNFNGYRITIT